MSEEEPPKLKAPVKPTTNQPDISAVFKSLSDKGDDPALLKLIKNYQDSKDFRDKLNAEISIPPTNAPKHSLSSK